MEKTSTQEVALRVIQSFDHHDLQAFRRLLSEDVVLCPGGGPRTLEGPEPVVAAIRPTLDALPDLRVEIVNLFASGNQAVVEVVRTGRHDGRSILPDGTPLEPTGRKVRLPECILFRVRDGKVARMTTYLDMLDTLRQVGLLPGPGST